MPTQTGKSFEFSGYYKRSNAKYCPLFLKDSSGNAKTGMTNVGVNMYLLKGGASSPVRKSLVLSSYVYAVFNKSSHDYNDSANPYFRLGSNSALIEVDAVNVPGTYLVELNTSDVNTNGILVFVLTSSSTRNYYGTAQVVEGLPEDIVDKIQVEDADYDGKAM